MADHAAAHSSTQAAYPWRATARTVFAFLVGLAAAWALIIQAAGLGPDIPWVATSLVIAAGITRVMALPAVDGMIRRFSPWLAPAPGSGSGVNDTSLAAGVSGPATVTREAAAATTEGQPG